MKLWRTYSHHYGPPKLHRGWCRYAGYENSYGKWITHLCEIDGAVPCKLCKPIVQQQEGAATP